MERHETMIEKEERKGEIRKIKGMKGSADSPAIFAWYVD